MSVVGNGKPVTEELTEAVGSSVTRFQKPAAGIATSLAQPITSLDPDVYDDGYLRIEHPNYYLTCNGQPVYLPRVEFLLVSRLALNRTRGACGRSLARRLGRQQAPELRQPARIHPSPAKQIAASSPANRCVGERGLSTDAFENLG